MKLFGFTLGKKDVMEVEDPKQRSFTLPTEALDDGAVTITQNAYYGTYIDLEGSVRNELELITRYREMANHPELEAAIDDIVNEAITHDEDGTVVNINLDKLKLSDSIKKKIQEEFNYIMKLLNFSNLADDLFKRWYIDGRIYFHILVNSDRPKEGIQELRYIDPRKIRKIREINKERDPVTGANVIKSLAEYYIYNDKGTTTQTYTAGTSQGLKIAPDSVINVNSGLMDAKNTFVISYLHSAIRPLNMLRMVEDAIVVYRVSRSPERRVFYIDVGNLPKGKAEQYLRDVMVKYRNKLVYDPQTGQLRDDRKHLSMIEDIFLPRREGCVTENTLIKLLDGRELTLKDLIIEYKIGKENWTYSVSPEGKVVPGKITWAGYTRENAEIVDVHLDNGQVITTTPDHKFILRNGIQVEAKDLQHGSSLMPFYTREHHINNSQGSMCLQIMDNEDHKWKYAHRIVAEYFYGPRPSTKHVIHHINYNRYDQSRNNLVYMDKQEHFILHSQNASKCWETNKEDHCKNLSIAGKAFFETEEGMKRRQEIGENNKTSDTIMDGLARGRETIRALREQDKLTMTKEEYLAKWSPGLSKMAPEMGGQAAKRSVEWDRENLTQEEWDAKYKSRGNHAKNKAYQEYIKSIPLDHICDIIKVELVRNINCSNARLIEKISEQYPKMTLRSLRIFLEHHGYGSISEFIHRNIGPEFISKKRSVDINQKLTNHKVVKVVPREDRQRVGTLTIDQDHEYHDYHNFALTAGVFVMNSRGTEITTLPAGQAISEIGDLDYFKKKLLQSLHVPYSRMEADGGGFASMGRSAEITRDELKYSKFIVRLRNKFSQLFDEALKVQLSLKGICTTEEWEQFKEDIYFDFRKDNNFTELREAELLRERMMTLQQVDPYIGRYFSQTWIKKNVLRLTAEEIEEMEKEIEEDGSLEIMQQMQQQEQPPEPMDNTYDRDGTESPTPQLDQQVSTASKMYPD